MKVCDEKADIKSLHFLPPENKKVFRSPHHKAGKLVAQKLLYVVRLLCCYGDSHGVDAGLYQDSLPLVPGDGDGVEEELCRLPHLHCRLVVSLHLLAGEIAQTQRGLQRPLNTEQVETQRTRLESRKVSHPASAPPSLYPPIVGSLSGPVRVVQGAQTVQASAGSDTGAEHHLRGERLRGSSPRSV